MNFINSFYSEITRVFERGVFGISLIDFSSIFLSIIITEYGRLDGVDRGVWE